MHTMLMCTCMHPFGSVGLVDQESVIHSLSLSLSHSLSLYIYNFILTGSVLVVVLRVFKNAVF